MSVKCHDCVTGTKRVPVLSVPGNIVYNNSNNMYMCMCMYREGKGETRNSGQ